MPSANYLTALAAWLALLAGSCLFLLKRRRAQRRAKQPLGLVNAGLAGWFALVMLTLPELWFAFVYDKTDSFSQTNVTHKWSDRHVRANKAGYRDERELPTVRKPGQAYIGFLGDSFTFGHGIPNVADRFSDRVAQGLESKYPGRTTVFNTGLPGMDIGGLTKNLVPELIRTKTPMDVLVYVFVPNDIEYLDERTAQYYQSQQSRTPQRFLFRDTYFYNWLYYRVRNIRSAPEGGYYEYLAESYAGSPWPAFARAMDRLHQLCSQKKVELRVVIFPFLTSLGKDDPFAPAYDRLLAHCREQNVPCLDLRPALLPGLQEGLVVNRYDAHPNERAHALAAEAILRDLSAPVGAVLEDKSPSAK